MEEYWFAEVLEEERCQSGMLTKDIAEKLGPQPAKGGEGHSVHHVTVLNEPSVLY